MLWVICMCVCMYILDKVFNYEEGTVTSGVCMRLTDYLAENERLDQLSFCTWAKMDADIARAMTLATITDTTSNNGNGLLFWSGTSTFQAAVNQGTRADSGVMLNDGNWHHACVTWKSSTDTFIYIYIY